jgi:REP element-mobilizing transposase RayT/predicted XRE-type DNA-binding protein
MLRGNERKNIFLEDEDKVKLIETIYYKKQENAFCLYAYCIMDNHVHLVIKEQKDSIARIMKRLGTSYAYYYNKKYQRVGHVFQDRYKSEAIEDERYLLSVIRYIHNNPEKAGICKKQKYQWSSYQIYAQAMKEHGHLLDCDEVLGLFSENKSRARILFKEFSNEESLDNFVDIKEDDEKLNEEEVFEYIRKYLNEKKIGLEQLNEKEYRIELEILVKELVSKSNLSLRRIAEITGINREKVRKINMSKEPSL